MPADGLPVGLLSLGSSFPKVAVDNDQVVKIVLTPAIITAMDNSSNPGTFVQVAPTGVPQNSTGPGVGKAVIVVECEANLQFPVSGGVAYATGTGDLLLATVFGFGIVLIGTADIKTGHSSFSKPNPLAMYPSGTDARNGLGPNNSPIVINMSTAVRYTAGNSNIVVTLRYRIIDIA
jgi:hypothetical protein